MEFVSVYKKGELIGVLNLDEVTVKFIYELKHKRYEFKKISKNVFENGNVSCISQPCVNIARE